MRTPTRILLPLLAAALLFATLSTASATPVRMHDPVLDYLQRCELKGLLSEPLSGALPYSRQDVAAGLIEISDHRAELSRVEQDQLAWFSLRFQDEIALLGGEAPSTQPSYWARQRWLPDWLFPNGHDQLYIPVADGKGAVSLNPSLLVERYETPAALIGDESTVHTITGGGGEIRFRYKGWSASGSLRDNQVRISGGAVDSARFPFKAGPIETSETRLDYFDATAFLHYQGERVQIWLGHGEQRWAGGETGSLQLGDAGKPYTQVGARLRFRPFELTSVQARLQPYPRFLASSEVLPSGEIRQLYEKKWMAVNRFEYFQGSWLRAAFFQQMVYGQREWDLEYLNPLLLVMANEYYTGDTDNVLIGLDFRVIPVRGVEVQLQTVFDEWVFNQLGSNTTNKWGFLLGTRWIDPFGTPNSQFWAEYGQLRPYTYSHKFAVNRVSHLGTVLGHPMGPNSEIIAMGWKHSLLRGLDVDLGVEILRHGANPDGQNVGGDFRLPETELNGASQDLPLLSGDEELTRALRLAVEMQPLLHLRVGLEVNWLDRELRPDAAAGVVETELLWGATVEWYPLF